ncbi:glycosyltransferase family 39 protein [Candidatus Woesearchaeota archaeon]|nr:glycosyltransferase family 39 protein [Candidatus Woesearchaeota archaeon]
MNTAQFFSRNQKWIFLALILALVLTSSISMYNKSVAWDERCYIGHGLYLLKTGNFRTDGFIYHGALSYYLNSLFLIPLNIQTDAWVKKNCWDIGNDIVFHSNYNHKTIVFLSRLPFVLISVLLGFYVFRWAKDMYGALAGLFSLALYSFSPSIIANSTMAMTDFTAVAFMFIALYYFWKHVKHKKYRYIAAAGIFAGLSSLSKLSGIYIFPILLLLSISKDIKLFFKRIIKIVVIGVIAFFVIFSGYGFHIGTIASAYPDHYNIRVHEVINEKFKNNEAMRSIFYLLYEKTQLPAPTYLAMIGDVAFSSAEGRNGYLLGEVSKAGDKPLYHFIVVFFAKSTLGFLVLLVMSLVYFRKCRKELIDEMFLIVPPIFMFIVFSLNQFSFDLRHILITYPLMFVFTGKLVTLKRGNKKFLNSMLLLLLAMHIASSLLIFPNYSSYFNEVIGPENGYKVLLGPDSDTGSELINLKKFMDEKKIVSMQFSYHGSVDPKEYGINYTYLPSTHFQFWVPEYKSYKKEYSDVTEDCSKKSGWIAISATNLKGRFLNNRNCFKWLESRQPTARIGYSIFVYNIPNK